MSAALFDFTLLFKIHTIDCIQNYISLSFRQASFYNHQTTTNSKPLIFCNMKEKILYRYCLYFSIHVSEAL